MFECRHAETTRVFTLRNRSYVVCVDCGTEIDYDLANMRAAGRRDGAVGASAFVLMGIAATVGAVSWLLTRI